MMHRKYATGSTLLELIVGVSLFSILALMAQPVFSEVLEMFELHGAARQVFAEMQRARVGAIMENTRCRPTMSDSGFVFECFDADAGDSGEWLAIVDQDLTADDLDGLSVAMSGAITFVPNGSSLGGGTIEISDAAGRSRSIIVSAAGLIRIE